jgi:hypothetical protein
MSHIHLRLISSTRISFDPTQNIWQRYIDRGTSARGEALRFILLNSRHHGSTTRSSWWICDSCLERCHSRWKKDDDLEYPTQEQEEWRMTTIGFEFHRSLKNSATTLQSVVKQPATINSIDGSAWPPIGTPSTTTWSSGLTLSEIQAAKPKESVGSGIAIRQRLIPPASTQRSAGLQR